MKFVFGLCLLLLPCLAMGTNIPGGTSPLPVNDPRVKELTDFVVSKLNEDASDDKKLEFVKVVEAKTQVVAGTKTTLTLELMEGKTVRKSCVISIWEQPWLNKREVTDVQCTEVKETRKKKAVEYGKKSHDVSFGMFEDYMNKFNKKYVDKKEYKKRFHIFRTNLKKIKSLTETEQGTGIYGVTHFADMSEKEFKQYLGLKRPHTPVMLPKADVPDIELPAEFDWRHYNVVTPVKNQGSCGSCWAFSVTGNIEGQWALKKGSLIPLSEQELVDCDTSDDGCGGGYMTTAYNSIVKIGGLESEKDYPYEAENEKCSFDKSEVQVVINGGLNITSNETGMAQWLVKNGPISVGLNANAMQFYVGGVSHPWKMLCSPDSIDHGVLIVGYGVHTSKILKKTLPYWIVKNSWGPRWGELGYYKLYRGDGSCGINQMASSAIIN